ncbi:hypothetical protein Patl1_35524 [Pistacia atlantica]|nr:hypothetical protein Patl1_35524 [Pistacia atlantica]
MVGALQDVRSNLTELRVLFYKVLEDLDAHLYNKGEYSSNPTLTATQPEVSSELQRRGESIAMDSDIGPPPPMKLLKTLQLLALDILLGYTFFDLVLIALMLCGVLTDVMKSMMQKHDHLRCQKMID